jgi:hypothetical protein
MSLGHHVMCFLDAVDGRKIDLWRGQWDGMEVDCGTRNARLTDERSSNGGRTKRAHNYKRGTKLNESWIERWFIRGTELFFAVIARLRHNLQLTETASM